MARIVVNTEYSGAATVTLVDELVPRLEAAGHTVVRNDWDNYGHYDIACFMSKDSAVRIAQAQNPNIVTVIMDPKLVAGHRNAENVAADLLVVTSLEQREAMLPLNTSTFVYHSFPNMRPKTKEHSAKKTTIIGYHGNREHLVCFAPAINAALDSLASEHSIELWVMYNIANLGKWTRGLPQRVRVRHIQWSEEAYYTELAQADIGICNNHIPVGSRVAQLAARRWLYRPGLRKGYPYRPNDYLLRYKYSTNPSRIYVFGMLGIPAISDFTPSSNQLIRDGHSGYIVHGTAGWRNAIDRLIRQPQLRTTMSQNLAKTITDHYSVDTTATDLMHQFDELVADKKRAVV